MKRKSIKIWLSDEERILVEAKAEYYGYKRLAPYIRDAAIYENVTKAEIKGKKEFFEAYNETMECIKQMAKDVRHIRTFATQFTENQRQELLKSMQDVISMSKKTDKKKDRFARYFGIIPNSLKRETMTNIAKFYGCTPSAIRSSIISVRAGLYRIPKEDFTILKEIYDKYSS